MDKTSTSIQSDFNRTHTTTEHSRSNSTGPSQQALRFIRRFARTYQPENGITFVLKVS